MLAVIDASLPSGNSGAAIATFIISYITYRTDRVVVKPQALPRASGRRPGRHERPGGTAERLTAQGPAWARDWTGRLRTLLAEAAAQGMPAEDIVRECEAALADFAFPAAGAEAWNRGGGSP